MKVKTGTQDRGALRSRQITSRLPKKHLMGEVDIPSKLYSQGGGEVVVPPIICKSAIIFYPP